MDTTPETISKLIEDLQGEDEFARAQAAFALGMLGEPAVKPLLKLLAEPSSEVRMRASWALGVIGPAALPALLHLAEGPDPQMRVEAIRVLGIVGEARALNQLLIGLTDTQAQVAARSARALGKIGDPRAFHALLTALHHPSPDVRYEVCRALADLHIVDAVTPLRELAAEDKGRTSWGALVAETARRAAEECSHSTRSAYDGEFARVSRLLQEHRHH